MARNARLRLLAVVVTLGVAVDQLSKYWSMMHLPRDGFSSYAGDLVRIWYAENSGAFLSLGENLDPHIRVWLLVVAVGVILALIVIYLWRAHVLAATDVLAYSLIVAGGIGNLIDRVLFDGIVRDFLNVGIGSLRTGIFNIADLLITTGVVVILVRAAVEGRDAGRRG